MARADLLISLVKAATHGDQALVRKTIEAMAAEERSKHHTVLAEQLEQQLLTNGTGPKKDLIPSRPPVAIDLVHEITPQKTLADIVVRSALRRTIEELVEEHHRADILRSYNLRPRNRLLLAGPPGNGKTSLAEALAHSLMVPLIVARYEGLIGSYLGETASRLRRLFDYVRTRACVLFFDEFDTVGKERGDAHETGEIKRVVSSLLLQIDGLPSHVVVVTATNHPELLDRAVWRRFQLRLELPRPSTQDIEAYLTAAEGRLQLSFGISPKSLAEKLEDPTFSELEDFTTDVYRRYVLALPDANVKKIVQQRLTQWQRRFQPRRTD